MKSFNVNLCSPHINTCAHSLHAHTPNAIFRVLEIYPKSALNDLELLILLFLPPKYWDYSMGHHAWFIKAVLRTKSRPTDKRPGVQILGLGKHSTNWGILWACSIPFLYMRMLTLNGRLVETHKAESDLNKGLLTLNGLHCAVSKYCYQSEKHKKIQGPGHTKHPDPHAS